MSFAKITLKATFCLLNYIERQQWLQKWIPHTRKHIKNGITQGSSANRSWAMVVHITGGGHFELCACRPLGGYPILFAVFFENSIHICNTMQNYKNLSPSAQSFWIPSQLWENFSCAYNAATRYSHWELLDNSPAKYSWIISGDVIINFFVEERNSPEIVHNFSFAFNANFSSAREIILW